MERLLSKHLLDWKKDKKRKPLILRGARQVGKTTLINQFSKNYKQYVYLNLEKGEHKYFFENFESVEKIVEAIFLQKELNQDYKNTLLFIDEIQEIPKAIQQLRYFYEDLPDLHVIAAGSLLEFSMGEIKSFPVGRVQFMYLNPLNFVEYLQAIKKTQALEALNEVPLKKTAHNVLMEYFHNYTILGGMPEVVKEYTESNSLIGMTKIYNSIWQTYKNDVKKYAKSKAEERVINHIISTAQTVLDKRVTFQNFASSNYKSREVGEALKALDDAKIIQLIYPTTNVEFPIITDFKKKPRLQFLDTGILNFTLGIQHELIALKDLSYAYKGALIPHIITQELISLNVYQDDKPHFWVREKNQSSAEVDLVVNHENILIPVEIKSGKAGKLRSLHQFMDACPHDFAIRFYGGKLEIIKAKTQKGKEFKLLNLPYFLGTKLPDYIEWFLNENP